MAGGGGAGGGGAGLHVSGLCPAEPAWSAAPPLSSGPRGGGASGCSQLALRPHTGRSSRPGGQLVPRLRVNHPWGAFRNVGHAGSLTPALAVL